MKSVHLTLFFRLFSLPWLPFFMWKNYQKAALGLKVKYSCKDSNWYLQENILSGFWWWGCWGGNWCIDRAAHVSEEDRCNCADIILGKQLYNWTDTLFKYCFILGIEEDSLRWDSFLPRYLSKFWSWLPLSMCMLEVMLTLSTWSTVSVEMIDQVDSGVGAFETPGRWKRDFVHLQPNVCSLCHKVKD